jgi:outer membrane protein OmpA-like peptidoglycan-associated protein
MSSSAPLLRTAFGLLTVLLMSACASTPSSPSKSSGVFSAPGPNAAPADPNAAPRAPAPGNPPATALATEQRFLEDWFRGTPVVIAAQPPVTLQLDVPLANSFDAGKADIKPALNAVLDRVAQSLLRQSAARINVNAPADASGNAALAQSRAQRVREALGSKGVAATRVVLTESAPRAGGPVQLRLTIPGAGAQPIARNKSDSGSAVKSSPVKPAGWTEKKQ